MLFKDQLDLDFIDGPLSASGKANWFWFIDCVWAIPSRIRHWIFNTQVPQWNKFKNIFRRRIMFVDFLTHCVHGPAAMFCHTRARWKRNGGISPSRHLWTIPQVSSLLWRLASVNDDFQAHELPFSISQSLTTSLRQRWHLWKSTFAKMDRMMGVSWLLCSELVTEEWASCVAMQSSMIMPREVQQSGGKPMQSLMLCFLSWMFWLSYGVFARWSPRGYHLHEVQHMSLIPKQQQSAHEHIFCDRLWVCIVSVLL